MKDGGQHGNRGRESLPHHGKGISADEQEARSRRYSNDRIVLLHLASGNCAVFNSGGDLCGFVRPPDGWSTLPACAFWEDINSVWYPPTTAPQGKPRPTLEELFK